MVGAGTREADIIAEIERLKISIRETRRRIEHARSEADKRVLNRQIAETQMHIDHLRRVLPR